MIHEKPLILFDPFPRNEAMVFTPDVAVELGRLSTLVTHFGSRAPVDVFPEEPIPADSPYRDTPDVLFSAHLAGGLEASYARIRDMMMDDIRQILAGLPPLRMQRAEPRQAAMARSR